VRRSGTHPSSPSSHLPADESPRPEWPQSRLVPCKCHTRVVDRTRSYRTKFARISPRLADAHIVCRPCVVCTPSLPWRWCSPCRIAAGRPKTLATLWWRCSASRRWKTAPPTSRYPATCTSCTRTRETGDTTW